MKPEHKFNNLREAQLRFQRWLSPSVYSSLLRLYAKSRRSLGQIGQDFWVYGEVFNRKRFGYFVDIGAADGVYLSNTFLLENRFKWSGICVEANPSTFRQLERNRRCICVNSCVDEVIGTVKFVDRGYFGGIVDVDTDNECRNEQQYKAFELQTETLAGLLTKYDAPAQIDYLSVDIEGAEDRVFRSFPFDKYCFRAMTLERPSSNLRDRLEVEGYIAVRRYPHLDSFFIHESYQHEFESNQLKFWSAFKAPRRKV